MIEITLGRGDMREQAAARFNWTTNADVIQYNNGDAAPVYVPLPKVGLNHQYPNFLLERLDSHTVNIKIPDRFA